MPDKFYQRHRYTFLLFFMLLVIIINPIIIDFFDFRIINAIIFSLVSVAAIYAITHKRRLFIIGIILIIPQLFSIWWNFVSSFGYMPRLLFNITHIVFLSFITFHIFTNTFRSKVINKNVIHGAIVVYLLLGFLWSFIYGLIECLQPGAFTHISANPKLTVAILNYFSFVTLTTLGYGDIIPATPVARAFCVLEAVIGQVYLIIQVSWLVGLYVAHTRDKNQAEPRAAVTPAEE